MLLDSGVCVGSVGLKAVVTSMAMSEPMTISGARGSVYDRILLFGLGGLMNIQEDLHSKLVDQILINSRST